MIRGDRPKRATIRSDSLTNERILAQSIEERSIDLPQSGSKNWRGLAIPPTIPIDSTRDVQTMHTIQIGTKTYHVGEPMAARLLCEAQQLAIDGRTRVSRGLVSLALKIENGTLSGAQGGLTHGVTELVA